MKAPLCLLEAFSWLRTPSLRKYIVLPLLINTLLFAGATYTLIYHLERLINLLLPSDSWLHYLHWLVWPLIALTLLIAIFYSFHLLANLIAAPFNGFLAQAVETLERGQSPDSGLTLTQEIYQSLKQELQKTLYFLTRALPILLISFIPVLNLTAPFLWFLYAAWVSALQYMDYPMANNGIPFRQQRQILKTTPLNTLSFGSLTTLLMSIPLLNLIIMPASVIGATLYWSRHLRPQHQP